MKFLIITCCITLVCSVGCNSHPKPQKLMPLPAPPPSYPPAKPMAIDESLRASAKREILAGLKSSDPIVRANSIEAAQNGLGADAAQQIMAALDDPEPVVCFAAAMACGRLHLSDAQPKLLALVDSQNANIRVAVRYALHRLGDTHYSHELETLAADP